MYVSVIRVIAGLACLIVVVHARKHQALRLDLDNGVAVCSSCHSWLEAHPARAREVCKRVVGEYVWEYLEEKMKEHYGYV